MRLRFGSVHRRVAPSSTKEHVAHLQNSAPLQKTVLEQFHISHKAKMVPFAGFSMPLSYGDVGQGELGHCYLATQTPLKRLGILYLGTVAAHNHVRTQAGLFDVSHMVQNLFTGPSTLAFLSHLCPSSLSTLPPYTSTLSVLLNHEGGIIDDMMVTKHDDENFYIVTNAGRAKEDGEWFEARLKEWNEGEGKGKEVKWERLDGWGLIALQGESVIPLKWCLHDAEGATL